MTPVEYLVSLLAPHRCLLCGKEPQLLCVSHKLPEPPQPPSFSELSSTWACTDYQGVSADLVSLLKFSRAKAAGYIMADALHAHLPRLPPDVVICPAPTANKRVRARGYDQASLIARSLARKRSLTYVELLRRTTSTRQVGANRLERAAQMQAAFTIMKPSMVNGASILLIDDVMTTGATLVAAASLLRDYGAKDVMAAVFAHKP